MDYDLTRGIALSVWRWQRGNQKL